MTYSDVHMLAIRICRASIAVQLAKQLLEMAASHITKLCVFGILPFK